MAGVLLDAGTIELTAPLVIAHAVALTAYEEGTAVLDARGAHGALQLRSGASVNLTGLTITGGANATGDGGGVSAEGAVVVRMTRCDVTGNAAVDGGGVSLVGDGEMVLESCTISANVASGSGGGVCVRGAGCSLRMSGVTLSGNSAARGGGLFVGSGSVVASLGTALRANSAATGRAFDTDGGSAYYERDAGFPPAHYLPNARCVVYRELDGCNATCLAARDECALSPVAAAHALSGVGPCTAASFVQPCDWEADPSLLGTQVYLLPPAPLDDDLPFACAAGVLGSADPALQASAECAGPCPAGWLCPEATAVPLPCPAGAYCEEGSAVPLPCPAGSWNGTANATSLADCAACPAGSACAAGATAPLACALGTFAEAGQAQHSRTCRCMRPRYRRKHLGAPRRRRARTAPLAPSRTRRISPHATTVRPPKTFYGSARSAAKRRSSRTAPKVLRPISES
jgi:hypothetical protein